MSRATRGAPHFLRHRLPSGEILLTPLELVAVRAHGRKLASQWIEDGAGEYAISYGAYIPQLGVSLAQAERDIAGLVGYGLGYLLADVVQSLHLVDIDVQRDQECTDRLPFAALVRVAGAAVGLLRDRKLRVSAFQRNENRDAATDILNRPGVFVMQSLGAALDRNDLVTWRERLDRRQARRLAREIA